MKNKIIILAFVVLIISFAVSCKKNNNIVSNESVVSSKILEKQNMVYGEIKNIEDDTLTIDNENTISLTGEIRIPYQNVRLFDVSKNNLTDINELQKNKKVVAYIEEAVGMSLPPFANAKIIFVNFDTYESVPTFIKVKSAIKEENGNIKIEDAEGTSFTISKDANYRPLMSRMRVVVDNIKEDDELILISATDGIYNDLILYD